jgi:hypothetical protein
MQATNFEFFINLKPADAVGLHRAAGAARAPGRSDRMTMPFVAAHKSALGASRRFNALNERPLATLLTLSASRCKIGGSRPYLHHSQSFASLLTGKRNLGTSLHEPSGHKCAALGPQNEHPIASIRLAFVRQLPRDHNRRHPKRAQLCLRGQDFEIARAGGAT